MSTALSDQVELKSSSGPWDRQSFFSFGFN